MLSVIILSVIMLSAVMLNVLAKIFVKSFYGTSRWTNGEKIFSAQLISSIVLTVSLFAT